MHVPVCRKNENRQAISFLKLNFLKQSLDMFEHAKKLLAKIGDGNLGFERLRKSQAAFANVETKVGKMQSILTTLQEIQTKHQDTDVVSRATVGTLSLVTIPAVCTFKIVYEFFLWMRLQRHSNHKL